MKRNNNHSTPQTNKMKGKSTKHSQNAPLKIPSNIHNLNKSLRNDTLSATAIIMSSRDFCNKPNVIYLNPTTILSTSFNFFGYVVAEYNDESIQKDTMITLSHVQQKIAIASELVLEHSDPTIKKDHPIFEYASHQLEGIVIKNNSIINLRIHDADINFKVVKLVGSTSFDHMNSTLGINTSKESINESDLTTLMDSLTLFKGDNKVNCDTSTDIMSASMDQCTYNGERFIDLGNNLTIFNDQSNATKIYGFDKVLSDLHNMIILPLKNSNISKNSGLMIPHGFLIYGHRGCGKTSILEKLCENSGVKSIWIDLREIKREYEDPAARVCDIFQEVVQSIYPTIIVLEDCELYFPKDNKELMSDEMEELCQVFLSNVKMIRKLTRNSTGVSASIIGTCSDVSSLSPKVYQNGIFDIEYEIPIPSCDERLQLLEGILSQTKHQLDKEQFRYLANHTHGYLPKDMVLLTQLSSIQALSRYHKTNSIQCPIGLTFEDFTASIREINPSVIKAFTTDIPKIRWEDIGGMNDVKNHLKECILWPILYSNTLSSMGIEPSSGVLLYGPPGCSKTMMARALAGESQMNFISIKGPELLNKYVGETEKTIRDARLATPCILFFDEMDAIAGQRDNSSSGHSDFNDRILAQFLTEIDGIAGNNLNLFVVAATNRPFSIDSALMRPGRFDRLVYVPLPDSESRESIFKLQFKKVPTDDTVDIENLVDLTNGYSGAEIVALCKEAAYCVLRENLNSKTVSMTHFKQALTNVRPRVTLSSLQMYASFKDQHYKGPDSITVGSTSSAV